VSRSLQPGCCEDRRSLLEGGVHEQVQGSVDAAHLFLATQKRDERPVSRAAASLQLHPVLSARFVQLSDDRVSLRPSSPLTGSELSADQAGV